MVSFDKGESKQINKKNKRYSSKFKDQPGAEKTWRRQRGGDLAEKAMDAPAKTKVSCFLILSIHLINYQLHMNQQESVPSRI